MASNYSKYSPSAIINTPPEQRRHLLARLWLPTVLLLSLAAGGLTGIIAAYELNYSRAANEVAALATYRPSVVTRVYADDGETVIGEFALEKRIPLKYEEIPPVLRNAILAVEDVRFYDHIGIDPIRIMGAAWKNLTTDRVEGGSTLTQQLTKNLFLSKEQTYTRKVNEWILALQIERYYTKNQIMELYTNHMFLGANAYGMETGAETYFGKQKKAYETLRAGLRSYDRSHASWRSNYTMIPTTVNNGEGPATAQELSNYKHPDWYGNDYEPGRHLMGLIMKVDRARDEATVRFGNFTATVTAAEMGWGKRQPENEFKNGHLAEFEIKEVDEKNRRLKVELSQVPGVQGAMMTLNAKTGEIVTMIGGYDFYTNKFNNAAQAYRQTGSCFKPFIYTAAVEWGMTPDTTVSGAPISIGDWQPQNYDVSTGCSDMPMKTALAKSMNIPAVHLLQTVGIQTGAQMVRRFGIKV